MFAKRRQTRQRKRWRGVMPEVPVPFRTWNRLIFRALSVKSFALWRVQEGLLLQILFNLKMWGKQCFPVKQTNKQKKRKLQWSHDVISPVYMQTRLGFPKIYSVCLVIMIITPLLHDFKGLLQPLRSWGCLNDMNIKTSSNVSSSYLYLFCNYRHLYNRKIWADRRERKTLAASLKLTCLRSAPRWIIRYEPQVHSNPGSCVTHAAQLRLCWAGWRRFRDGTLHL